MQYNVVVTLGVYSSRDIEVTAWVYWSFHGEVKGHGHPRTFLCLRL